MKTLGAVKIYVEFYSLLCIIQKNCGIEALNEVIQSTYESVVTEMDTKATAEEKIADWFTSVVTVLPISTALIAEIIKNRRKKQRNILYQHKEYY